MRRAIRHAPLGIWDETQTLTTVTLAFDDRYRRRIRLTDDDGQPFLLDLDQAVAMADGDGLALDDGEGWIRVAAAAEPVMVVTASTQHLLMRLAWHIGNRHLPADLQEDRILLRPDHVIESMVIGLGGRVLHASAPFQPEGGAYAGEKVEHHHHHDHHHHDR